MKNELLKFHDFFRFDSFLFHTVSMSNRYGSFGQAVMIDGNAVRCTDLVLSAVTFSDISTAIVLDHISLLLEIHRNLFCHLHHLLIFFHEREDSVFHRSECKRKSHNNASISFLDELFIVELKHRYHDSSS